MKYLRGTVNAIGMLLLPFWILPALIYVCIRDKENFKGFGDEWFWERL